MSDSEGQTELAPAFSADKLVAARDSNGLTTESIQRELRLTSKVVKAIESGDLHAIGQPVFARGYIRAYCKRVGLDAEPFITQYDAALGEMSPKKGSRVRNLGGMGKSKPVPVVSNRSSGGGLLGLIAKIVLLVLVIGGGYLALEESGINVSDLNLDSLTDLTGESTNDQSGALTLPITTAPNDSSTEGSSSLSLPIPSVNTEVEPPAVAEEPTVESLLSSEAEVNDAAETLQNTEPSLPQLQTEIAPAPVVTPPVGDEQTSVQTVAESALTPPTAIGTQALESEVVPAAAGDALLTIAFDDVSWINIRDASGESMFNGLAEKDRTLNLSGEEPISLVIGRADAIRTLIFNDAEVDLAPFTRNNVARLTLGR